MSRVAPRLLFCDCGSKDVVASGKKKAIRAFLDDNEIAYTVASDLCGLAATGTLTAATGDGNNSLVVIACHQRAVNWLLSAGGLRTSQISIELLDMRSSTADEVVSQLRNHNLPSGTAAILNGPFGWISWFPVIDYDRCTNCAACLSFCLFGTFTYDADGRVTVTNPSSCKTYCPACARVCPQAAIIFPKYADPPVNGADVTDDSIHLTTVKVDFKKILGEDPYAALQARQHKAERRLLAKDTKDPEHSCDCGADCSCKEDGSCKCDTDPGGAQC